MSGYEWERLKGESQRAYDLFTAWRKIPPPRPSWAAYAREQDVTPNTIRTTASRWNWKARADAWDAIDHTTLEDAFNARVSAVSIPDAIGPAAAALTAARIARTELVAEMAAKALEGVRLLDPAEMKAADIIALARVVVGLDQAALTINVGDNVLTIDRAALDNLSLEDARAIIDGDVIDDAP